MKIALPKIIQGGMGAGVSSRRLARAVSGLGQLGVLSGTGLAEGLSRRLQDGDADGSMRRALDRFPFPDVARRIAKTYYRPEGRPKGTPYVCLPPLDVEGRRDAMEMAVAGNFVEVFLAKEGHSNPIGINYLEKIQISHLPSLYGALLAGVDVVIVGAGIPLAFPETMRRLARHERAIYPVNVIGADGRNEVLEMAFDPSELFDVSALSELSLPDFLPIVSSDALASILLRRAGEGIDGFVIESNLAGGHNAPPRGKVSYSAEGEPIYGERDDAKLSAFRKMGLPFWLAGSVGSPEGLRTALEEGAAGVQVGTAFALCEESGLLPHLRHELIRLALAGKARIFTDPLASPTGFPFKVADLPGTLTDAAVYAARRRRCDLGFLRQPYRQPDGAIGYRCPAEPVPAYLAKGGAEEDTLGRKCLCNALVANIGMPQIRPDGREEPCLVTLGDDLLGVRRFCRAESPEFSAADVVAVLLGDLPEKAG